MRSEPLFKLQVWILNSKSCVFQVSFRSLEAVICNEINQFIGEELRNRMILEQSENSSRSNFAEIKDQGGRKHREHGRPLYSSLPVSTRVMSPECQTRHGMGPSETRSAWCTTAPCRASHRHTAQSVRDWEYRQLTHHTLMMLIAEAWVIHLPIKG